MSSPASLAARCRSRPSVPGAAALAQPLAVRWRTTMAVWPHRRASSTKRGPARWRTALARSSVTSSSTAPKTASGTLHRPSWRRTTSRMAAADLSAAGSGRYQTRVGPRTPHTGGNGHAHCSELGDPAMCGGSSSGDGLFPPADLAPPTRRMGDRYLHFGVADDRKVSLPRAPSLVESGRGRSIVPNDPLPPSSGGRNPHRKVQAASLTAPARPVHASRSPGACRPGVRDRGDRRSPPLRPGGGCRFTAQDDGDEVTEAGHGGTIRLT